MGASSSRDETGSPGGVNHPMAVPSIQPHCSSFKQPKAETIYTPRGNGSKSVPVTPTNSAAHQSRTSRKPTLHVHMQKSMSSSGLATFIQDGIKDGGGTDTSSQSSKGSSAGAKRPLPGTEEEAGATEGNVGSPTTGTERSGPENFAVLSSPFAGTLVTTTRDQWKVQVASRTVGEYGCHAGTLDVSTASGYRLPMTSVDIHPSGQGVITASMTGETHLFQITPEGLKEAPRESCPAACRLAVGGASVHCAGEIVATGSWDKQVRLFNSRGQEIFSTSAHDSHVTAVAFSPDGQYLATGGGDKAFVRVWAVQQQFAEEGDGEPWDAGEGGTGEPPLKEVCINPGHWAPITGLSFSTVDETLASSSADGTIRLWDLSHAEPPMDMGFSAGAAATNQNRTRLYKAQVAGTVFREMESNLVVDGAECRFRWENPAFEDGVVRMCHVFDSDACGRQNESRFQYVDSSSGEVIYTSTGWLRTLKGHSGRVNGVTYSPNGELLASCGDDGTVRIWDAQCTRNIDIVLDDRFGPGTAGYHILSIEDEMTLGDHGPTSMKIQLDDEVMEYEVEFDTQGHFYSHGSGPRPKLGRTLPCPSGWADRTKNSLYKIVRRSDGRVLFDWDASKLVMKGHCAPVRGVAFILGGLQVVSCAEDAKIRLWDVELGTCQAVVNAPNPLSCLSVMISPPLLCLGDLAGCVHVVDGTLFDASLFVPDGDKAVRRGAIGSKISGSPTKHPGL